LLSLPPCCLLLATIIPNLFSLLLFSFFSSHSVSSVFHFRILTEVLPAVTPYIAALAACSFLVLLSTNIKGKNKILFQSGLIALATSVAAFFFISHASEKSILDFWRIYQRLSYEAKFALGVLTIGAAYFGGALYVGNIVVQQVPASKSDILQTPATQSVNPPFDIPDTLDSDDKVFFQNMLER
jgi:hypothetical protein